MARFRLYVPQEERVIQPEPRRTHDRVWIAIGLLAWIVALGVGLALSPAPWASEDPTWFWVCVVGIAGGLVLLVVALRYGRR